MSAHILVIEDNAANLELMTYLLKAFGYTTLTAWDGEAGLQAATQEVFDLIICDIELPGLSGYEVAQRLKQRTETSKIPLVAVTAYAMVDDHEKALAAGFDGYISKPIEPELFVSQIESFLNADHATSLRDHLE
jgi:CheY-like chemotaxis protein